MNICNAYGNIYFFKVNAILESLNIYPVNRIRQRHGSQTVAVGKSILGNFLKTIGKSNALDILTAVKSIRTDFIDRVGHGIFRHVDKVI